MSQERSLQQEVVKATKLGIESLSPPLLLVCHATRAELILTSVPAVKRGDSVTSRGAAAPGEELLKRPCRTW